MDALQCGPPDAAGDAAALLAATSPAVPSARTVAMPARNAYQPGLCLTRIPMLSCLPDGCQSPWNAKPPIPEAILPLPGHGVSPLSQKTTKSNEKCHTMPRTSQTAKLPYIRKRGRKRASVRAACPTAQIQPASPAEVPAHAPVAAFRSGYARYGHSD